MIVYYQCQTCGKMLDTTMQHSQDDCLRHILETWKKAGTKAVCWKCGKKFKKLSEYTYKPNCKCISKEFRISIG